MRRARRRRQIHLAFRGSLNRAGKKRMAWMGMPVVRPRRGETPEEQVVRVALGVLALPKQGFYAKWAEKEFPR